MYIRSYINYIKLIAVSHIATSSKVCPFQLIGSVSDTAHKTLAYHYKSMIIKIQCKVIAVQMFASITFTGKDIF